MKGGERAERETGMGQGRGGTSTITYYQFPERIPTSKLLVN